MRVRRLHIQRFRGIQDLTLHPTARTVLVGPNNAGKSTILEALDLLLYPGLGRSRPPPTEIDYFDRDTSSGFEIEAIVSDVPPEFLAEAAEAFEGWNAQTNEVVPEIEGDGIEPVVRVRVRGLEEFDVLHEFAKAEIEGTRFPPRLRDRVGWVFDGRTRDPGRQLAFYQGGLLERLFRGRDLGPALDELRTALGAGARSVNEDAAVAAVLSQVAEDLRAVGLLTAGQPGFEVGAVSNRELLQSLRLALPGPATQHIPLTRHGRGSQRLVLLSVLLRLSQAGPASGVIGGFEEPEEALEPLRQLHAARMLRQLVDAGGQIFVSTHSPDIVRAFDAEDVVLVERDGDVRVRPLRLSRPAVYGYERRLDMPIIRALFVRFPVIVEGVSDRVVFSVFWDQLARDGVVGSAELIGLEAISAEGASNVPLVVQILAEAGKRVVAWLETDRPDVVTKVDTQGYASCLIVYPVDPALQNLELAIAHGAAIASLGTAMSALADDRGFDWIAQRNQLLSRAASILDAAGVQAVRHAPNLMAALDAVPEGAARQLVASCLAASGPDAVFEIKGGRSARIFAEVLVSTEGVPGTFADAITGVQRWIESGATPGARIDMQ